MTKEEYLQFHKSFCDKMIEITKKKNHDYTGSSADPFANFKKVEDMGIASVEVGFLTRMTDKFSRLNSFVQKGVLEVKDESIADTLCDLANYSALLAGYIESKRADQLKRPQPPYTGPIDPIGEKRERFTLTEII